MDTLHLQDKEGDAKLSLKSTAILFGDWIKIWLTGFGVAVIFGLALIGCNSSIGNTKLLLIN